MAKRKSTINSKNHPLLNSSKSTTNKNLERWRKWIAKGNNHQKKLDYLKKWRLKNKNHVIQYRLKHKERDKASIKAWQLRNKDRVLEYRRRRRLRKQEQKARLEVLKQINELVNSISTTAFADKMSAKQASKTKALEVPV